jgi:hypothetical protein
MGRGRSSPRSPRSRRKAAAAVAARAPFSTTRQATFFVAGLTAFFGGFLAVVALFAAYGAHAPDRGPVLIAAVLFFGVALAGHFVWIGALRYVQENLTGERPRPYPMGYPSLRVISRSLSVATIREAAKMLSIPGPLLVAWLYGLLFGAGFGFFFAIARSR